MKPAVGGVGRTEAPVLISRAFRSRVLRPRDQHPDATPERVRSHPGFVRLREALAGGLQGRLDALPAGGGGH